MLTLVDVWWNALEVEPRISYVFPKKQEMGLTLVHA